MSLNRGLYKNDVLTEIVFTPKNKDKFINKNLQICKTHFYKYFQLYPFVIFNKFNFGNYISKIIF